MAQPVNDEDAAQKSAEAFVRSLTNGDLEQVYAGMAPQFRGMYPVANFKQNVGFYRIQWGGQVKSVTYVGSQRMQQLPSGQTGDFFYVRFRTVYPNVTLFTDVYLTHVGSDWQVGGFYFLPVPTQQP